jgi:HEPN domain-containing protein/predicted nucleotidyltransferase
MKSSLDHLPEDRRTRVQAMAATIQEIAPQAGMIILFGSHARGDWVSDPATGYKSDFDLLVVVDGAQVTEDSLLWSRVSQAIQPFAEPSFAQVIVHDFRFVNEEIRRGQFFWVEIWQQGVVLYDSKRFTLARPKAATPEERKALAQEYFDHWFTSAREFFVAYEFMLSRKSNSIAAFQLHQAAERFFSTALLVFTATKPLLHDLEKLGDMASPLHPLLAEPFPRATEEDDRLFKLLKRAYIESRYSKSYRITEDELRTLGERVRDLGERVERACREKIESFA